MYEKDPNTSLVRLGWLLHLAGLLVTVSATGFVLLLVLVPTDRATTDALRDYQRLSRRLAGGERVRGEYRRLKTESNRLQEEKAQLRRRITDGTREAEFLQQVTGVADELNLRLREFRPGAVSQHGEYGAMRIGLTCEGSYASICHFLDRLHRLPRLSKVSRLDIPVQAGSEVYPLIVQLDIYFAARSSEDQKAKEGRGET